MQKETTKKLIALGISLMFFLVGCVDTSVQPLPQQIDYKSQVNIVNLADAGGLKNVVMNYRDNQTVSFGAIGFGAESPANAFKEIPAGSKKVVVTFSNSSSKTFQLVTDTDIKMRLFVVYDSTAGYKVVKFGERMLWQTNNAKNAQFYPKDSSFVALVSGLALSADSWEFKSSVDTTKDTTITFKSALNVGDYAFYEKIPAGKYTVSIFSGNTTLSTTQNVSVASQGRYTAILYGSTTNVKFKLFKDD